MPENRRARACQDRKHGPGQPVAPLVGREPWWARCVLAVYLIGFADGTAAHARDLVRAGFDAYSGFPQVPLRVFFTTGNWSRIQHDPAWPFTPAGLLLIIVFGAFVLATAPVMLRAMKIVR